MLQDIAEKRSEFRFPVAIPVEYFNHGNLGTVSYSLDISRGGTFISSDYPLEVGKDFPINLTIPFNMNSSKIIRTKGAVEWTRVRPYKSVKNGMGIRFFEDLPESLLLDALTSNVRRLVKESEAKKKLEERLEDLESKLFKAERWSTLGKSVEKILFDISNPLTNLCGKLALIKEKMQQCSRTLEENDDISAGCFKKIIGDFDDSFDDITSILNDYNVISELVRITGEGTEDIEEKIREYNC